jgi:hypothetical protein
MLGVPEEDGVLVAVEVSEAVDDGVLVAVL